MYDLVVRNGAIIDGTGSPAYHGDIAISDGKIIKIARNISGESRRCIDARGLTVTPGFIDSHSHSDNAMLEFSDMVEKIEQGITTSIGGQCGNTPAPISKDITEEIAPLVGCYGKANEVYKTFGTMTDIAKTIPMGSNIMSFVGHGALRKAVIGFENRTPTEDEMEKMKELLRDAMDHGALGLSYGLIYTPGCYADTAELIELAKVVKQYNGVISAHIRNEGFTLIKAVEEFLSVIRATDVKAVFSHHKSAHKENWGKVTHSLRMIDEAVEEGYDVYCDVYPYIASHTDLVSTIIAGELRATDNSGIVELVSRDDMRKKIMDLYAVNFGLDLSHLQITFCKGHPEYQGLRISRIAEMRNQSHFEAAFDLIAESGACVNICNFSMCEEDVEYVMRHPRTMICTDSSVAKTDSVYHPRLRGTFPRVLGRYVRERGVTTLWEMIRKCTSMPASVYGISNKGILGRGFDADICIFNADTITDKADFINCHERCRGLDYVILGGEVVVEDAVYNGKKMGRYIPRQK